MAARAGAGINTRKKVTGFSNILSDLRKERGISQKKAAADLGISQALLSHYEKGIRECGLDFVIKCSKYYGVTSDYLLGISEQRNGLPLDYFSGSTSKEERDSVEEIVVGAKYLIDLASSALQDDARKYLHDICVLDLYDLCLTLAKTGTLPTELFKLDHTLAKSLVSAAKTVEDAKFILLEDRSRTGNDTNICPELLSIIKEAENSIVTDFIID